MMSNQINRYNVRFCISHDCFSSEMLSAAGAVRLAYFCSLLEWQIMAKHRKKYIACD